MTTRLFLLAAAALVVAPAAAILLPGEPRATVMRTVELDGPILGFDQSHDRIQVRLVPLPDDAAAPQRTSLLVRDARGEEFAVPLKPGQTWISAKLPEDFADASSIKISVR